MKVLVTGGCGFIGSNLVPLLLEHGHNVRVLDDLSTGTVKALEGREVDLRVGDVRDEAAVADAVRGVDGVVHLAAHTSVIDSQHQPLLDFEINARGTLNMLLACRDLGVKGFVFASSNAPIGETTPPIDESKAPHPLAPYGASKLAGEGYCSAFFGSYGLKTLVLRFANVYGPRSGHKGSVVARFLRDAVERGELTVYGDGQQTRDFIYVEDLCRAVIRGLESDCGGETFQIATGHETRIVDLAEMVCASLPELKVSIVHQDQRAGEIVKNYSCIDKARRILGWEPRVSLDAGLNLTVEWFRSQQDGV